MTMSDTRHQAAAAARKAAQGTARSELRTALLEERRGYVQRGNKDRVAQVDAQLDELGPDEAAEPEDAEQEPETPAPKSGSARATAAKKAAAAKPEQEPETPAAKPEPEKS
jgi:hypothetical protein